MRYSDTSFLKKSQYHAVLHFFFFQDGDITVEDFLNDSEDNASFFWLAPGAHAMGCPGVSEGTTLMKFRAAGPQSDQGLLCGFGTLLQVFDPPTPPPPFSPRPSSAQLSVGSVSNISKCAETRC